MKAHEIMTPRPEVVTPQDPISRAAQIMRDHDVGLVPVVSSTSSMALEALRTHDALQLSVALGLKRAGLVTVFVAADQKLCRVAMLEGFAVTNPEQQLQS